jgi:glycosyltransferase involved in cell wall biosynthesis
VSADPRRLELAFVVPRYGLEILGGAELGARMLAEHLVEQLGWPVEVFTTCARDHVTWENDFPEGTVEINGVRVHRFRTTSGRPARFFSFSERILSFPEAATIDEADEFVRLQGPGCEPLVDALRSSDKELFAFYPYLYTTTTEGLPPVAQRSIMHPAAHDEPALHLSSFRRPMCSTQGFAYHTLGERALVQRLFPVADVPEVVLGLGLEDPGPLQASNGDTGSITGLGDRPYVLCLGRVDGFKGTTMLGAFFGAYKERNPGPLALVIAGPVTAQPPAHRDVVVTGPVDERHKWALMNGATAFVQPSPHESFSIVLMEAWSRGLAVLVNARCEVTREHVELSGGGLSFGSYAQFEVALDRLTSDTRLRRLMGDRGRRFVEANFRWPAIVDKYAQFTGQVMERIESRL